MKPQSDEITFSISQLSKEFDITTRSIRFYEGKGLLNPSRRGQTRVYSKGDKVKLKLVLRGKRLGFSLAETKRLFALYDNAKTSATQLKSMLGLVQDKKAFLHQQMDDIKMLMMELVTVEKRCINTLTDLELQPDDQNNE
jgi:DNA-binding transcriptional MerR regulator